MLKRTSQRAKIPWNVLSMRAPKFIKSELRSLILFLYRPICGGEMKLNRTRNRHPSVNSLANRIAMLKIQVAAGTYRRGSLVASWKLVQRMKKILNAESPCRANKNMNANKKSNDARWSNRLRPPWLRSGNGLYLFQSFLSSGWKRRREPI